MTDFVTPTLDTDTLDAFELATCKCIEEVDAHLAKKNTRLSRALVFRTASQGASDPPEPLMLQTERIAKKRGAVAVTMFPSYCPFCGRKYGLTANV